MSACMIYSRQLQVNLETSINLEEAKAVRAAVEEAVQLGEGEGQLRGGSTSNI
jgi:hypothetical protein